MLYVLVQIDKIVELVVEMFKEVKGVVGDKLFLVVEISKIKDGDVCFMLGSYQIISVVMGVLQGIVLYYCFDDYVQIFKVCIEVQIDVEVNVVVKEIICLNQFIWVIVGDLFKIEQLLKKFDLGVMQVFDVDGKLVMFVK